MSDNRVQAEIKGTCDMACEILEKTNDGNNLDSSDLQIIELAVNGNLNSAGREVFVKLYRRVVIDNYVIPYLHGIEHLTRDHYYLQKYNLAHEVAGKTLCDVLVSKFSRLVVNGIFRSNLNK